MRIILFFFSFSSLVHSAITATVFVAVLHNHMPSSYWWLLYESRSSDLTKTFQTLPEGCRLLSLVAVALNQLTTKSLFCLVYES